MNPDLNFAIECARKAGEILLAYFGKAQDSHLKADGHPVSEADLATDRFLRASFSNRFPDDAWLSEETQDDLRRLSCSRVWIVDPLDGTKEFLQGIPEFSISIALLELNLPKLAVVYNPAEGDLVCAEYNRGLNRGNRRVSPLRKSGRETPRIAVSRTEWSKGLFHQTSPFGDIRAIGSIAYKLALLAAGEIDLVASRTAKSEWDVCAGSLLVSEAGAKFTDFTGAPVQFNRPEPFMRGVLAAPPHLHERALRWMFQEKLLFLER